MLSIFKRASIFFFVIAIGFSNHASAQKIFTALIKKDIDYAKVFMEDVHPDLYACGIDFWGISNYFTFYNNFPPQWKPYMAEINRRWGDVVSDSLLMYQVSPVFHVKNIKAPVFIGQSANDRRVVFQHSEQMVEELKKYNKEYAYVLVEGEGHALTNEKKLIDLMTEVENFLAKHMQK